MREAVDNGSLYANTRKDDTAHTETIRRFAETTGRGTSTRRVAA